ncbi:tetratricopeptide repeat protein [Pseudoalteromonas luteoviolacea]|uniref:tetratricopeptide repeat protein n=1 Tax=Pseudoalteromonas luteoviolacea TaxID=43657 RepID=UPI001B39561D|nr:tetratricopeptide repeat protein [Pseudoalteromonas luteoviolacea]MBQ4838622.1 tetratricopeptide repeat protein [Pseudoalteromonas luteoviolacea]
MPKIFTSLLFLFSSLLSTVEAHETSKNTLYKEGDIYIKQKDKWETLKIINVGHDNPDDITLHVTFFEHSEKKPTKSSVEKLGVLVGHTTLSIAALAEGWESIGNKPVSKSELGYFYQYLKHNNFQKYAHVTGQKVDELIALANIKYKEAYALSEQKKFNEAISLYLEALDIFPPFYEAIDNIAFIFMDNGDCPEALKYFDHSLSINPNNVTARYYMGQCYIQLREYQAAASLYKDTMEQFPDEKEAFEKTYFLLLDVLKEAKK